MKEMGRGEQRDKSTHPPSSSGCAGPGRAGTQTPGCPCGCAARPHRGTRGCHSGRTPRMIYTNHYTFLNWVFNDIFIWEILKLETIPLLSEVRRLFRARYFVIHRLCANIDQTIAL